MFSYSCRGNPILQITKTLNPHKHSYKRIFKQISFNGPLHNMLSIGNAQLASQHQHSTSELLECAHFWGVAKADLVRSKNRDTRAYFQKRLYAEEQKTNPNRTFHLFATLHAPNFQCVSVCVCMSVLDYMCVL